MAANYEEMTIPQLEAEIGRIQGLVTAAYGEQLVVHKVMERKIALIPVKAGPLDQVVDMNMDVASWFKSLPPAIAARMKDFFSGEGK